MTEIFNGAREPLNLHWEALFALAPMAFWAWRRFVEHAQPGWLLPGLSALILVLAVGVPIWDRMRVSRVLATGEGSQETVGVVSAPFEVASHRRRFNSSGYDRWLTEGFCLSVEVFSWVRHSGFSSSTFSNRGAKTKFVEGTPLRITWFEDPAAEGERRIIKIEDLSMPE